MILLFKPAMFSHVPCRCSCCNMTHSLHCTHRTMPTQSIFIENIARTNKCRILISVLVFFFYTIILNRKEFLCDDDLRTGFWSSRNGFRSVNNSIHTVNQKTVNHFVRLLMFFFLLFFISDESVYDWLWWSHKKKIPKTHLFKIPKSANLLNRTFRLIYLPNNSR